MSWLTMAAGLLRDAFGSTSEPAEPVQEGPPPANIAEVMAILNQHRSEIDKNFEAVASLLNAQKTRHLKAMESQRRWNYGLAVAVLLLSAAVVWLYVRK